MSVWWDDNAKRYRSTLPHKVLYRWGWPVLRWLMFLLTPETAHHAAIRGIQLAGWIDRIWGLIVLGGAFLLILLIRALLLLPWFTWEPDGEH